MSYLKPILTAGLILAAGSPALAQQLRHYTQVAGDHEFSGQMIVRPIQPEAWAERGLDAAPAQARVIEARNAIGAYELSNYVPELDHYIIDVPEGKTENDVAADLMGTGLFQYAEPNWIVYPLICPDDSLLDQQWHHREDRMDSCAGWDLFTGDPSITVGICDTGIRTTHEDFQLHRLEGYNAVDQMWENSGGNIGPIHPHGTMTTGCAAGNGNNGIGISGVGWNLSHRMIRVSNSGSGGSSLETLQHGALTSIQTGDKVASVSYSGVANESNLTAATEIRALGGLLVWAAGNSNQNMTIRDRDDDDIIVAGGTDINDVKSGFSSYGIFVDVVAPATAVFTADAGSDSDYGAVDGTSFACPLTAGLIALIWSGDPSLTPDEVEAILKGGCDDLGEPGIDDFYAYGRINVFNSLSLVRTPLEFVYPDGTLDRVDPNGGSTIRVEVMDADEVAQPGTGMLHYDDGSGFVAIDMEVVSNNVYDAVFPAFDCESEVLYYFSAETTLGEVVNDPSPEAANSAIAVLGYNVVVDQNFESAPDWTVENFNLLSGAWELGTPSGNGFRGTPTSDYDESGQCWVTGLEADNDVDLGPTVLTSPRYDMAGMTQAVLSYARFFYNDDARNGNPGVDFLDVFISNDDGDSWTLLERVEHIGGWELVEFMVSDVIAPTNRMRLKFSVEDNPNNSVTEAAIDRLLIREPICSDDCYADFNGDGTVNTLDFLAYLNAFNASEAGADCTGDGSINTLDFLCFLNAFNEGCP